MELIEGRPSLGKGESNAALERIRPDAPSPTRTVVHPPRANSDAPSGRSIEAAEAACRRNQDLLKTVVDSSRAMVYMKDCEGRYQLINRQWAELFDVTPEAIVGKTDFDVFPIEIANGFRANDAKILAGRRTVEVEELAPHPDGLHTYLSIKTPLIGPDGVPYGLCGISTDVTERKRMEEALRMSEEQFRGAFDASAIGMGMVDPEGEWLRVNPALCEIIGYSEEELVGSPILALSHPDDLNSMVDLMGKLLASEFGSFQTEKYFIHKHGKILWIRLSASLVRNLAGRSLHFVVQFEDVTPRRQAEELAGALHAEMQEAYEATIAGWARALDLRDHETEGHSQRVTEMTLTLARVIGIPEADLVHIRRGALLHDIGKMGVPDAILLKPGPLTVEELPIMRRHPEIAVALLEPIAFLRPALDIPHCHHERWDGTGYPRGLSGQEIPLAARIFAVVDVWDALTHDRPYRPAWSSEGTRVHLRSLAGTHLDPAIVDAFLDSSLGDPAVLDSSRPEPIAAGRSARRESQPWPPPKARDPIKDPARLDALRQSGLMDSPADLPFDRLVSLACKVLHAPVAIVSLVDDHRQFFKSSRGLPEPWVSRRETPHSHSICRLVVRSGTPLILPDARLDSRLCDNRAVPELGVIAYAGMPLRTAAGHVLGSFCVIDSKPRQWTGDDIEILEGIAEAVMTEIDLRGDIAARRKVEEQLRLSQRRVAEQLCISTELDRELEEHRRARRRPGHGTAR